MHLSLELEPFLYHKGERPLLRQQRHLAGEQCAVCSFSMLTSCLGFAEMVRRLLLGEEGAEGSICDAMEFVLTINGV